MTRPQVLGMVAGGSAAAMLVAVLGALAAWSTWRLARRAQEAAQSAGPEGGHWSTILRRTRFLGMVGILGSAIFLLGLLLTATAALVVSPCVQG
ncbi:hypothetical protein AWB74_08765 [Caballeronia arvi]|uniref:Uncharacterized protein n=1 Tax=Caballeronia arvi TaxID=1777135 RepID=A0A158L6B1_9BURK|nr:hypothetical protein [Caballeronia arvi]SAL88848.1 hypothetical protein AWB74_08765 [Caballeronia arvi]